MPRAHRKRRRRCPRQDGRGRGYIPKQRLIDTRPGDVASRKRVGHWEGDLIQGAPRTGNLATAVERKTRFTLPARTDTKEAGEVTPVFCAMFSQMPKTARVGLTLDNGKEFACHEALSRSTGLDVFFAHAYHAWERSANENTNGLIRRLYTKTELRPHTPISLAFGPSAWHLSLQQATRRANPCEPVASVALATGSGGKFLCMLMTTVSIGKHSSDATLPRTFGAT